MILCVLDDNNRLYNAHRLVRASKEIYAIFRDEKTNITHTRKFRLKNRQ